MAPAIFFHFYLKKVLTYLQGMVIIISDVSNNANANANANRGEKKMEIQFIDKDQDWANETTRYWFNVDGDDYCLADQNGDLTLLDCDGCPIHSEDNHSAQGNASDRKIYNALVVEREKHLND